MNSQSSKKVFRPHNSRVWNFVLLFSFLVIILALMNVLPLALVLSGGILIDVLAVFLWFSWAKRFFEVELWGGRIQGPSKGLKKTTILVKEVDTEKMRGIVYFKRKIGFYRILSKTGDEIRLYCRILSPKQIEKIFYKVQEEAAGYGNP